YFSRPAQVNVNLKSDDDAIQLGYWLVNTRKDAKQRVASITLDAAGTNALWPVVLSIEVGDRVTVKRRPKAANRGAGIVMVGDYFVEQIVHNQVDMANGIW